MLVIKQHESKILCTERAKHIPSWLSIAQHNRNLSSASPHSQVDPSTSQMQLVKETQMIFFFFFLPARVKTKSEAGNQRGWIDFLKNLQKQHFLLNRILVIMMSNGMLVPTENTRAIKFKHENRRHTGHKRSLRTFLRWLLFFPCVLLW